MIMQSIFDYAINLRFSESIVALFTSMAAKVIRERADNSVDVTGT
jgi:hypothetical protein